MFEQVEILELWRPVIGYEGLYEVSNWGRVRSLARMVRSRTRDAAWLKSGKLLSPCLLDSGYLSVALYSETSRQGHRVATLVAATWLGRKPLGLQIDHKDGNKLNNCSWNLRYLTAKENYNAGNFAKEVLQGERHPRAKLSREQVIEIRRLILEGMKQKDIAKMFGVCRQTVNDINTRKHWNYGKL